MTAASSTQRSKEPGPIMRAAQVYQRAADRFAEWAGELSRYIVLVTVAVMSLFGVSHGALLSVYAESVLGSRAYFAWVVSACGLGSMIGALTTGMGRGARQGVSLRAGAVGMAPDGSSKAHAASTATGSGTGASGRRALLPR